MMASHNHNRRGIRLESCLGNIQLIVTLGRPYGLKSLVWKTKKDEDKRVGVRRAHSAGLECKSDR
jgi:hypothetical protein